MPLASVCTAASALATHLCLVQVLIALLVYDTSDRKTRPPAISKVASLESFLEVLDEAVDKLSVIPAHIQP